VAAPPAQRPSGATAGSTLPGGAPPGESSGSRPGALRAGAEGGRRARARIAARTLRTDRWWVQPAVTVGVLLSFVVYATYRAFANQHYFADPYISPFYSPCVVTTCQTDDVPQFVGDWWTLSPALLILAVPLGFRMTCYYYRKAYYRSFWMSPPACAVAEPHRRYTGETRLPLLGQNLHRYFFYAASILLLINVYDAFYAFSAGFGLGNIVCW